MINRGKSLWLNLSQSLGFVPGVIVLVFGALGVVLVEIDEQIDLDGVQVVFKGDGAAARTVLSVIAGSLITVAGLTFSTTMVVLQLAASQFSPRILRTFFGDRVTQVTIGVYVGTFVYAILVLRAVGSYGDAGFVPRLSVTLASLFGIGAVILLVVFLHHVSQLIQVSHVTGQITRRTLAQMDVLYPARFGDPCEAEDAHQQLRSWRSQAPGCVLSDRPGYVQRVGVDNLSSRLAGRADRIAILVCPGDFVSGEMPIVEIWPAEAAEECRKQVLDLVAVGSERDLSQDIDFGLRQLADTAIKALSPGINDPMTAVTCIGYLRTILVRLAERAEPPAVRRLPEHDLTVIVRRRAFDEHLEAIRQVSRYVEADAWVAGELLRALGACTEAAWRSGAHARARSAQKLAATVAKQSARLAGNDDDRAHIEAVAADVALNAPSRLAPPAWRLFDS